jgi:hypothetical protein
MRVRYLVAGRAAALGLVSRLARAGPLHPHHTGPA